MSQGGEEEQGRSRGDGIGGPNAVREEFVSWSARECLLPTPLTRSQSILLLSWSLPVFSLWQSLGSTEAKGISRGHDDGIGSSGEGRSVGKV